MNKRKDKLTYNEVLEISREGVSDPIGYHIYRRIAALFAYLLQRMEWVSPNIITFLFFLFNIGAACLCFLEKFLLAGILMILADILDATDGTLARVRNQVSRFGGVLDALFGDVGIAVVIFSFFYRTSMECGLIYFVLFTIKNTIKMYTKVEHTFIKKEKRIRVALTPAMVGYLLILANFYPKISTFIFVAYAFVSLLLNVKRGYERIIELRSAC